LKITIIKSIMNNSFIIRRYDRINEIVNEKMMYYPPCDYTYIGGFNDYFDDVSTAVIREVVDIDLNLEWEKAMDMIDDFSYMMENSIREIFFRKIKSYFDKIHKKGCGEGGL